MNLIASGTILTTTAVAAATVLHAMGKLGENSAAALVVLAILGIVGIAWDNRPDL